MSRSRKIKVNALARVEGEGALNIQFRDGAVEQVQLKIYEPPRFFEALLRGRDFAEAPDITARICGICPVAYQMSACTAMEDALGTKVSGPIQDLRRLLYCGEWIQSHALHIYFLHAPDFLGLESAVELAATDPQRLQTGIKLKAVGNDIMRIVGGRDVHPVNVKVGGFYSWPDRQRLSDLLPVLEDARQLAVDTVEWVAGFDFPDFTDDYEFVALHDSDCYAIEAGTVVSSTGLKIPVQAYEQHFEEYQEPHSNALHSRRKGGGRYITGPMARYALNRQQLSGAAGQLVAELGLEAAVRNPFRSIIVRALEVVYCCEEALRLVRSYAPGGVASVPVPARHATGYGCTEAPRGLLYHRYDLAEDGSIQHAKIVPPTSQNQGQIELDLKGVAERNAELDDERLQWLCEQTIRNYDPCISCATHFLKLHVERQ
jgi:sulfhydrogenase subunit alpha